MAFLLARVGPKGAAGAAAGLASLPALAECRAATVSGPSASPVRQVKNGDAFDLLVSDGSSSQQEAWLAPEFKDGEYLGYDEVQDALSDVLSVASGRSKPAAFAPYSDDSSEHSFGADADSCIEASDSAHDAPPELSHMMHRLLNNADVQRAVMGALQDSPELEELLGSGQLGEHMQPLYSSQLLLPAVAMSAATDTLEHRPAQPDNPVQQGLKAFENGLEAAAGAVFGVLAAIGANIAGAGDGLGRLVTRLAAEARAALQGKGTIGVEESGAEVEAAAGSSAGSSRRRNRRSLLTGTLFTVAVAIISMIIFKRARLVRVVRT